MRWKKGVCLCDCVYVHPLTLRASHATHVLVAQAGVCVRVCVRVCVLACMLACVGACVRACVGACVCVCIRSSFQTSHPRPCSAGPSGYTLSGTSGCGPGVSTSLSGCYGDRV